MTRKCIQCGAPIHLYAADFKFQDGTTWQRAGTPMRSQSINGIDPQALFCTLRCAARYGVHAATSRRH